MEDPPPSRFRHRFRIASRMRHSGGRTSRFKGGSRKVDSSPSSPGDAPEGEEAMEAPMPTDAPFVFFLVYAAVTILFHLYFSYGLQMMADSQDQPELARALAWIPGLQIYTYVRCGGGNFGNFLLLFLGGAIGMMALGAFGAMAGAPGLFAVLPPLWALLLFGYLLTLNWRLAERQGLPGAFSLLMLLPLINLVAWWMLAYRGGFQPVQKLGFVLGLVFLLASIAPAAPMFRPGGPMALALAQNSAHSGAEGPSAEVLAELQRALEEGKSASEAARASLQGERAPAPAEPFDPEYSPEKGRCPPGSRKHGARPPRGLEQWCAREGSDGRVRHGWYVKWHESGVRAVQGSYRDGERTGMWTRWHPSGRKSAEARFRDGEQNGVMRRWNAYGEQTSEVHYRDGEPVDAPAS